MCGILGIVSSFAQDAFPLSAMSETLKHRGPDDSGIWFTTDGRVGLAHRRLSILDLSPLGRNPMRSDDGRLSVVHNGEIYNFRELRLELRNEGYQFKTETDTEVILAAYDKWGVKCLGRFNGMFAFGLWDNRAQTLFLARDRIGEKPLYYAEYGNKFLFASELKAIVADPEFQRETDPDAIALYLRYGYIPAPYSIFRHARKLLPGHYALYKDERLTVHSYWDPVEIALNSRPESDELEATEKLEELLKDAVRLRMIADVPLGAFLSGGIDSSLLVALMKEQSSKAVKTFTIRFDNPQFNEADYAAAVAKCIGTEHYEETCSEEQMLSIVDLLPDYFDEPFADSSAIPTYLLSRITREHVTVSVSGDGGDEVFFGYPRYHDYAERVWLLESPRPVQRIAGEVARLIPRRRFQRISQTLRKPEPDRYARWITWWRPEEIQRMTGRPAIENVSYSDIRRRLKPLSLKEHPPIVDLATYLPDDILTKVDRATMAASLESRAPYLDHRIVEFSLSLPLWMKWRQGKTKWILRKILYSRVPPTLLERPKAGFSVPLADWFRGPLRERAASAFAGPSLENIDLNPDRARLLWADFLTGNTAEVDLIWSLFALTSWAQRWKRPAESRSPQTFCSTK